MNTTRNQEMLRLYNEEHLTLKEIGERYGISHQRVSQILIRQGYIPRLPEPGIDYRTLRNYQQRGFTSGAISKETGYTTNYITFLAKQYGIKLRHGVAIPKTTVAEIYRLHQRGLTQTEIADCLDIAQTSVSNYLKGII